ncbi:hypothetical protein DMENIID0001_120640 [Sergentomyia squamirostris]
MVLFFGRPKRCLLGTPRSEVPEGEKRGRTSTVERLPCYHSLTYVRGMAERVRRMVRSELGTDVAFSMFSKCRSLFSKVKDPVESDLRSCVVYNIPCGGCDKSYIGTTKQYVKERIKQHARDSRPPIKEEGITALAAHSKETGHQFRFDDTTILDVHKHHGKRKMLESLHIQENINNVTNRRSDVANLSTVYSALLHLHARKKKKRRSDESRNTGNV